MILERKGRRKCQRQIDNKKPKEVGLEPEQTNEREGKNTNIKRNGNEEKIRGFGTGKKGPGCN